MDSIKKYLFYGALTLLVYMPFHIFLSQWLSTASGGLDYWKVGKDVFLLLLVILAIILVWLKQKFSNKLFWGFATASMGYGVLHLLAWASNPQINTQAALIGTTYNCRLLAFAILGWAVAILLGSKTLNRQVFKIAVIVGSLIAFLGVLQYFLPKDLLTHFGYSIERGVRPAFFIDSKPDLPRIMSTLRDPNSLGAYLILPITALVLAWLKKPKHRILWTGLLLINGLALLLTSSRSAWVGAFLSVMLVLFWCYKKSTLAFIKKYWLVLSAVFIVLIVGVFLLRDQYIIQNYVFHSDENTQLTDSNNLHLDFAQQGLAGIADKPFGHGPGTAGLVSIQTDDVVLTENYFIQIGYEVGVQGLVLLLAIMGFLIYMLYKQNNIYSKILIASFIGITFCNLLLHTWSNEAVAGQWWLIAGLAMTQQATSPRKKRSKTA